MNKENLDTLLEVDVEKHMENIPTPQEIEDFENSRVGIYLIANIKDMQRQALIDIVTKCRVERQGDEMITKILPEGVVEQMRGQYMALDNLITLIQIAKEEKGESS